MSTVVKDLGAVSAYAYAVEKGYAGTEAEFAELMADYAEVAQRADDAAESALNSKTDAQTAATTATNKASEATTAAQTATTKAGEAQTSAQTASNKASEASQSASQASGYAQTAETAKTAAQTAKTQAETARDNAVTAKTAAETAQGKAEDAQAAAESVAESIPSDYSQLSEDVTELKSGFTQMDSDVKAEEVRAKAEEARIEALFTAPTQEAVDNWLDAHPEATTTVENGAITLPKLNDSLKDIIVIMDETEETHIHDNLSNPQEITFVGNSLAFGSCKFANNKNYFPDMNVSLSKNNASLVGSGKFVTIDGTPSSDASFTLVNRNNLDIPAGEYVFDCEIQLNGSVINKKQWTTPYRTYDGEDSSQTMGGIPINVDGTTTPRTVTFTKNVKGLYVTTTALSANTYKNLKVFFRLYKADTEIIDTGHSVESGDVYAFSDRTLNDMPIIDTLQHQSTIQYVANTKEYVDNHVPSDVVTKQDLVYVSPEMFGAVGDGTTDDSAALQRALDASVEGNVPMMGFGSYRADTTLILSANNAYVYIHKLDYRGNGEAAFILRGRYNHLVMDRLYAYYATGSAGFRLETTESTHADYNQIEIQSIYADMNAVEFYNLYGESHGSQLYYNNFKCSTIYSAKANCFYFNGYQHFAENSFWGKHVSNNNGYFLYCESGTGANNNTNRFYEFCIESSSKNGVFGIATLINCRTTECMDRKKQSKMDEGNIFVFDGVLPAGRTIETNIDFIAIDVSNALTLDDSIAKAKELYENGSTAALAFDAALKQKKYIVAHGTRLMTFLSTEYTKLSDYVLSGTTFAYFNHKGWIPDNDWYYEVVDSVYHTYETDRCIPTIFDIKTNTEIHLDDSYCAIGIKQFKVVQTDNEKATIYDHNGVLIFDGGQLDAGAYKLYCELLDPDPITIETSKGTITRSSKAMRGIYLGNNEKWSVEKLNVIS